MRIELFIKRVLVIYDPSNPNLHTFFTYNYIKEGECEMLKLKPPVLMNDVEFEVYSNIFYEKGLIVEIFFSSGDIFVAFLRKNYPWEEFNKWGVSEWELKEEIRLPDDTFYLNDYKYYKGTLGEMLDLLLDDVNETHKKLNFN